MKKEAIKLGNLYTMKVGKTKIAVRIMSCNEDGHWIGSNIKTNNNVIIKSANQLIGVYRAVKGKTAESEKKVAEPSKEKPAKPEAKKANPSGLDSAAKVLEEAGNSLNCQEIVKQMLDKGLWKTDGKTPAATIYSAIIREIKEKGGQSRFRKTERGKFEFAK